MADEHDKWLDREAAERLLRGEPLKAVAPDDVRRAERLAAAFDALMILPAGPEGELPGEDAALKAFREAGSLSAVKATAGSLDDPGDLGDLGALGSVDSTGSRGAGRTARHRAGGHATPGGPGP
ncbi:hypothetical protein G3I40_40955, partial [Streptomyces sp. SID14478]|nr:hypothetical protein [Streptomyces sp. SID14478]